MARGIPYDEHPQGLTGIEAMLFGLIVFPLLVALVVGVLVRDILESVWHMTFGT